MLEFLKRIFPSSEHRESRAAATVMASEDLERIEHELEKTPTGYAAARLLNRAGDLYLVKGDRQNALKRYGNAIDAYLQASEYDNAMAVCRKIIRVVPEVIRTRRTLAWLCLGKGFLEIAREHIEAYAAASLDAGLEALAVQHLQLMAQYVDQDDFRAFLAEKLEDLGDKNAAERVEAGQAIEGVRAAGWTPVVFAAMLTPEELRTASAKGVEIKAPTRSVAIDDLDSLLFDPELASAMATAKGAVSKASSDKTVESASAAEEDLESSSEDEEEESSLDDEEEGSSPKAKKVKKAKKAGAD